MVNRFHIFPHVQRAKLLDITVGRDETLCPWEFNVYNCHSLFCVHLDLTKYRLVQYVETVKL